MSTRNHWQLIAATMLVACAETTGDPTATSTSGVAPPGSDAQPVSSSLRPTMDPGEADTLRVTMQNTGAGPCGQTSANDWTSSYYLFRPSTGGGNILVMWGGGKIAVSNPPVEPLPCGETEDFWMRIEAPRTPGPGNLTMKMSANSGLTDVFGTPFNGTTTVQEQQRRWDCEYVSDTFPRDPNNPSVRFMTLGQRSYITVTVRNTGFGTWPSTNTCMYPRDIGLPNMPSGWGAGAGCSNTYTNRVVPPNDTFTFGPFLVVAPMAGGSYPFKRVMLDGNLPNADNGVGFFDRIANCVGAPCTGPGCDFEVQVAAPLAYDAIFLPDFSTIDDPVNTTLAPGESRIVTVAMQNTGIETWTPQNASLISKNIPANLWGPVNSPVTANVPRNEVATFTLAITAPEVAVPTVFSSRWRMSDFGETTNIQVLVDPSVQPGYGAVILSETYPTRLSPGQGGQFRIRVRNTGSLPWSGSNFGLTSLHSPTNLWGPTRAALGAAETVNPGEEKEFVINVTAPNQPDTMVDSLWRMERIEGSQRIRFGETTTGSVPVTICGNGALFQGEECDDGNIQNGDGCSSQCVITAQVINLAAQNADRTVYGQLGGGFATAINAIGDVNGDGIRDVATGWAANVGKKAYAGKVNVRTGAGILSGLPNQVLTDDGDYLEVLGAAGGDQVGAYVLGNILIADIVSDPLSPFAGDPDGVADLIVSSGYADCGAELDCGAIYVIRGGSDLGAAVTSIDLALPPSQVRAIVRGGFAAERIVVRAVADMTGDGIPDLIVGGGGGGGRVEVVSGGAALQGDRRMNAPGVVSALILGDQAGGPIGQMLTTGDVSGDGRPDLVLGAPAYTTGTGGTRAGAVFVFHGPVAGTRGAGSAESIFYGPGPGDNLGSAVAVGDVDGVAGNDLLIGVSGLPLNGQSRQGAVDIWRGPVTPGTRDLAGGASATFRIVGGRPATFGVCIGLGDMTGDGRPEIAIGAPFNTVNGMVQAGEMAVVRGGPTLASSDLTATPPPLLIQGVNARARMCQYRELSIGDLDQDGRMDLVIGSSGGAVGGAVTGRVDMISSRW